VITRSFEAAIHRFQPLCCVHGRGWPLHFLGETARQPGINGRRGNLHLRPRDIHPPLTLMSSSSGPTGPPSQIKVIAQIDKTKTAIEGFDY